MTAGEGLEVYESVTIGWDGGPAAEEALRWALGRRIGYRYRLLRVVEERVVAHGRAFATTAEAQAASHLRAKIAEVAMTHADLRICGAVTVGDPMAELERWTGPSALLVLGSEHGPVPSYRHQWTEAGQLAASAHGPVAVVPHDAAARVGPVLAGVKDTPACRAAAHRAAELAEATWSDLELLHAWQPDQEDIGIDVSAVEAAHAALLQEVADEIRSAHPDLRVLPRLVRDAPTSALCAGSEQASVVVLGRPTRWTSSVGLLQSVSYGVLRTGRVPVLLVGPREGPDRTETPRRAPQPFQVLGAARQIAG